ncbi:hypothetical protein Tco_0747835 [Tanacetum coccineum]|uniref:Uncharacterized protein n=1 Tax=Tanacetum coccineum TaxID=301880 RepID=A0ABQ4YTV2_9ASTR
MKEIATCLVDNVKFWDDREVDHYGNVNLVFNWKTATYGKIRVDDDLHNFSSVEAEFPAIVINDAVAPQDELQCKSQVSTPINDEIDFRISFDESDDEDYTIFFDKNLFSFKMISVNDLKTNSENDYEKVMPSIPSLEPAISCFDDLDFFTDFENKFPAVVYNDAQTSKSDLLTEPILNPQHIDEFDLNDKISLSEYDEEEQNVLYGSSTTIHRREVHRVLVFNFRGLLDLMAEGLSGRMLMEHHDEAGFQLGGARRRMSWRQFILALGLQTEEEMQTAGFGVYWAESARQIANKGDLRDYWMRILSARDFLGTTPSYNLIRDPILMLLFATGRKNGEHISGGQFVARLAEHFGLLTAKILGGLMAWVAIGLERQPDATAGAPNDAKDAPIIDEGGQADPTPEQAPQ